MKPKLQLKTTKTKLISKPISSLELENNVQIQNIHKDILGIISKYAGGNFNTSAYTDKLDNKQGFFLMWIKKDTDLPLDEQIQIHTFARLINFDDVVKSMEKTINDMSVEQNSIIGKA